MPNSTTETTEKLKSILGLEREPVGIKFVNKDETAKLESNYDSTTKTRYCQALMRAGNGEKIMITSDNITCPASAAAFGLKPLPEMLSSGNMLLNMGLFASAQAGSKAMSGMTRIENGKYHAVLLSPLDTIEYDPDVIIVESKPEHLMWLSLASIYETGERLQFDSAIFQATCVDSTIIPFIKGKINSTLGCYGCREATNIRDEENMIGIPFKKLNSIILNLEKLAEKPMKRARLKEAFNSFSGCGQ